MWVTQTYLGRPDPDARLFVYYVWSSRREERDVPEEIIQGLTNAGRDFGRSVELFAPISGTQDEIRAELRYRSSDLHWLMFNQETACLFLTTKPLGDLDPHRDDDEFRVLPLPKEASGYEEAFRTLHEMCTRRIQEQGDCDDTGFLAEVLKAIEVRPSIFGVEIDLKQILSRAWVLRKRKMQGQQPISRSEQGWENVLAYLKQALEAQHTKVAPFDVSEIIRKVNCAHREAETLARDLMAANDPSYDRADRLLRQVTVCRDALLELEGGQATERQLKERIRALLDELNSDRP